MRLSAVASSIALAICLGASGCVGSEEYTTPRGLQEENRVLRKAIAGLEGQVKALQAERAAGESSLKKEFEDRLAKVQQFHQEKLAQQEATVAGLRLELGAVQREKLAYKELVDRTPRAREAREVRAGVAQTVQAILFVVPLVLLVMVAMKYHSLRDRMNLFVTQNAASYRAVEGPP
jgi:hypothetical protein